MVQRFDRFSMAIAEINRYWHKLAGEEMKVYGLKGPHATFSPPFTVILRALRCRSCANFA